MKRCLVRISLVLAMLRSTALITPFVQAQTNRDPVVDLSRVPQINETTEQRDSPVTVIELVLDQPVLRGQQAGSAPHP